MAFFQNQLYFEQIAYIYFQINQNCYPNKQIK